MRFIFVFLFFLICFQVSAVEIPTNMNSSDLKEMTHALGTTTGIKPLTKPFPLGGYDGFEVGLSLENIETEALDKIGDQDTDNGSLAVPKLTFSKGLYYDFDLFIEFSPLLRQESVSEYGLLIRKSVFQSRVLPLNLSFNIYGSAVNILNCMNSESYGTDLVIGYDFTEFALYGALGNVVASSITTGTKDLTNVTSSGESQSSHVQSFHSMLGVAYDAGPFFFALQADSYQAMVYSMKLGLRL